MPFVLPVLFDLLLMVALASVLRLLYLKRRVTVRLEQQLTQVRDESARCNCHVQTLTDLNRSLQSSETLEEAIKQTVPYLPRLFAVPAGALYVADMPDAPFCCVYQWGEKLQQPTLAPADCHALNEGRPFAQPPASDPRRCRHLWHAEAAPGGNRGDAPPDAFAAAPGSDQAFGNNPAMGGDQTASEAASEEWASEDLCLPLAVNGVTLALLSLHHPGGRARELLDNPYICSTIEQISLTIWNLRLRETLRQQSIRDPLTRLYNRRYLEESLLREVSRAERRRRSDGNSGLAVLMIDVDHFKRCNDLHGHEAGDALLREIARTLRELTRASDIASRYGGEEFVLVLADVELEGVLSRAEDIRKTVETLEVSFAGKQLPRATISIGIALYPDHGNSPAALIRAADVAMYEAKHAGRNRVRVAPPAQTP